MSVHIEDWDDLRVFLATVRAGSVAAAARALGIDPTTITRRMNAFEARVGRKLFDRLRGGVLLSPEGETFLAGAEDAEAAIRGLERRAGAETPELRGPVRLAVQELLAIAWAEPIQRLAEAQPDLTIELTVADAMHDLTRREADLAIRGTAEPPLHLVGRKLSALSVAVYGAERLADRPLRDVPWIGWTGLEDDEGEVGRRRAAHGATGRFAIRVNAYGVLMAHLLGGTGVSVLPCALGERTPGLRRLTDPEPAAVPLWVLTHPDLQKTPRIRYVLDGMAEIVAQDTYAALGL